MRSAILYVNFARLVYSLSGVIDIFSVALWEVLSNDLYVKTCRLCGLLSGKIDIIDVSSLGG